MDANVSDVFPGRVDSPSDLGSSSSHDQGAAAVDSPATLPSSANRHERRTAAASNDHPPSLVHPKTVACLARASQPVGAAIALLTRAQVAKALGVSPLTVYRMSRAGILRALKLRDNDPRSPVRYRTADIVKYIESR